MTLPFVPIRVSAAILLVAWPVQGDQGSAGGQLDQAKAMYESAEYDSALSVLDGITVEGSTAAARDRAEYRVLCLLALGRNADAETAAVQIIDADPLFSPGPDVSPRLRALLHDVRKRLLPALVQTHYQAGKDRYDRADYPAAIREFTLTIGLFDAAREGDGPAAPDDIRTLAVGFRDLATHKVATAEAARETSAQLAAHRPTSVEPVPIRQDIPSPPPQVAALLRQRGNTLTGSLEIVISPRGDVDQASVSGSIHPAYDALLLAATKRWKYRPGSRDGTPVEFVKRVIVNVRLP